MESSNDGIVTLNVGGVRFCTSSDTLMKGGTTLSEMFSGGMPIKRDKDGAVFIDRDGKHFNTILNFLRNGTVPLPKTELELEELKLEAEFYGITQLIDCCKNEMDNNELGDEFIEVHLTNVEVLHDRFNGSTSTKLGISQVPLVLVPLMADGTVSLSILRSMFTGATCLGTLRKNEGKRVIKMLKMKNDKIFPPTDGSFEDYTIVIPPMGAYDVQSVKP